MAVTTTPPRTTLRVRTLLWVGIVLIGAAIGLGAFIYFFRDNGPFTIDALWMSLLAQSRGPFFLNLSYAMNWLGGGWFGIFALPIMIAIVLVVVKKPWGAVYFIAAELASAAAVQILKHLFGRARPEDIVVVSDFGSFPSGHVANAATIAVALCIIFPRVWVAVAGMFWVLLMAFSRTYLGAHWLSDTLGGALVGAGAALLIAAACRRLLMRDDVKRTVDAAPQPPAASALP